MTKKLLRYYLLIMDVAFGLFVAAISFIIQNNTFTVAKNNAKQYLSIVTEDYVDSGFDEQVTIDHFQQQQNYLRITFIAQDGSIVFDSHSDTTENHADRIELLYPDTVYKRFSATLQTDMLYVARWVEDGQVFLRVAIPVATIPVNSTYYLLMLVGYAVLLIVLSYSTYSILMKNSSQALLHVSRSLGRIIDGEYQDIQVTSGYSEIDTILERINRVNQQISHTLEYLAAEKNKTTLILNSIQQGIVAIGKDESLLLVNQYVQDLFEVKSASIGQNFLFLIRNVDLQKAILQCMQNKEDTVIDTIIHDSNYRITILCLESTLQSEVSMLVLFYNMDETIQLDRMKKEFFTNASHELKSPLTSIVAASELVAQKMVMDADEIVNLNQRIHEEALRMKTLVLQMLNLSKFENARTIDKITKISFPDLVAHILQSLQLQIQEKQIQVHLTIQDLEWHANYDDMYHLLSNLVENAIHYGKVNGNIWIHIDHSPSLKIEVKDDGIGIDKIHHERVFERFYRVDVGRSRASGSTGLGLAIVKHIAVLYKAKIMLQSAVDQGTSIQIIFPK